MAWYALNALVSCHLLPIFHLYRRRLYPGSPAGRHELYSLELPWSGERPGSSSAGNFDFSAGSPDGVQLSVVSSSAHHIDAEVGAFGDFPPWRLTDLYGFAAISEWSNSWDLIRQLRASSFLPWMIFGDFNEVLLASEKTGGQIRSVFSDARVSSCGGFV